MINRSLAWVLIMGLSIFSTKEKTRLEKSPGNTKFYVDSVNGNDKNKGTSPKLAWHSLDPVNRMEFKAGDKILFKSGGIWSGQLRPHGSGKADKPIIIDKYGKGAKPVINGQGKVTETVCLRNQQQWEVNNLQITNYGKGNRSYRRAVFVEAKDIGEVNHIYLNGLEIRDVNGLYRGKSCMTNGGIICMVTGNEKPTRFKDLRIENCIFRTRSIERYCVVVSSSWENKYPTKAVYRNNTLDHTGRAYIVIPVDQWPREKVYYYCPDCQKVFSLAKTAAPICPYCGRIGCEDIFSEIAARLFHAWEFFDATRYQGNKWLFKRQPENKNYSLRATTMALGAYGELRCMGFVPPWGSDDYILDAWTEEINRHIDTETNLLILPSSEKEKINSGSLVSTRRYVSHGYDWNLSNRVFIPEIYQLPPGQLANKDHLRSKEAFLNFQDSLSEKWAKSPWGAGSWTTRVIDNHQQILKARGEDPQDEMIEFAHKFLDKHQNSETGAWFGEKANHSNIVNGIFKVLVSYEKQDWPIHYKKEIVDFVLQGSDPKKGFAGAGCSVFDPMMVLWVLRSRGCDYRAEEVDEATAKSALTFFNNWNDEIHWFKEGNWSGKHNLAIPLYMACLLLDQPYMKICTIYNWREAPIVKRKKDGTVIVNPKVIYSKKGFPFEG